MERALFTIVIPAHAGIRVLYSLDSGSRGLGWNDGRMRVAAKEKFSYGLRLKTVERSRILAQNFFRKARWYIFPRPHTRYKVSLFGGIVVSVI